MKHEINISRQFDFSFQELKSIPEGYSFASINGVFRCNGNNLTSIFGSPEKIGYYHSCIKNDLFCLDFAPLYMRHHMYFRTLVFADDFS
jgi:hypothetical protein